MDLKKKLNNKIFKIIFYESILWNNWEVTDTLVNIHYLSIVNFYNVHSLKENVNENTQNWRNLSAKLEKSDTKERIKILALYFSHFSDIITHFFRICIHILLKEINIFVHDFNQIHTHIYIYSIINCLALLHFWKLMWMHLVWLTSFNENLIIF